MIPWIPPTRMAERLAVSALAAYALLPSATVYAFTPSKHSPGGEGAALNLGPSAVGHPASSGAGIGRTIVGLVIVIAVIWGLSWILRQVKAGRGTQAAGIGLMSLATLPLESGRALHLVRAGSDYVLVGSAEHGVVPIHRYSEEQARMAGLTGVESVSPEAAAESSFAQLSSRGAGSVIERLRSWTVRR